jgi:hypothetical protein
MQSLLVGDHSFVRQAAVSNQPLKVYDDCKTISALPMMECPGLLPLSGPRPGRCLRSLTTATGASSEIAVRCSVISIADLMEPQFVTKGTLVTTVNVGRRPLSCRCRPIIVWEKFLLHWTSIIIRIYLCDG